MGEQTSTSPAAIEAEIVETRARLASTIDELAIRAQPKEIARRQAESAKAKLIEATHTPEGDLRVERVGAIAAGSAVLLGLAILRRHRHHGGARPSQPWLRAFPLRLTTACRSGCCTTACSSRPRARPANGRPAAAW